MAIVHHHLIYQASVGKYFGKNSEEDLRRFLYDLLGVVNMECLIPAQLKFSHQKAWTGIIGIVTSHISFHYWTVEKNIQLDIYSCKEFDRKEAINFINDFWDSRDVKTLFVDRDVNKDFDIKIN